MSIIIRSHDTNAFFMIDDKRLDKYELCNQTQDIEREWEIRGGVVVIFLNNGRFLLTLRRCMPANILERTGRSNLFSILLLLWSIFGANEQWSSWSMAHLKDCSIGLLHSFGFIYFCVIIRAMMMIVRRFRFRLDFRK